MIKVVLDTNIVVSANLKAAGLEALVLSLAMSRNVQMYVSPSVLAEYEKVLRRKKFNFASERIEALLQLIGQCGILLTELPTVTESRHEADNRFLECAEAAGAEFLITGNTKDFPAKWKNTRIVTARQLLERIAPELANCNLKPSHTP